jgi:hypothetical protein
MLARRTRIAVSGLALALVATAAGCGNGHNTQTVTVIGKDKVGAALEDNGSKGRTKGDEAAFSSQLTSPGSSNVVGHADGTSTLTELDKHGGKPTEHRLSTVVYSLDGGQIVSQGAFTATLGTRAGGGTKAITGGTGKYDEASGSAQQSVTSSGQTKTVLTIKTPKE